MENIDWFHKNGFRRVIHQNWNLEFGIWNWIYPWEYSSLFLRPPNLSLLFCWHLETRGCLRLLVLVTSIPLSFLCKYATISNNLRIFFIISSVNALLCFEQLPKPNLSYLNFTWIFCNGLCPDNCAATVKYIQKV
jgi:hypothetical protein